MWMVKRIDGNGHTVPEDRYIQAQLESRVYAEEQKVIIEEVISNPNGNTYSFEDIYKGYMEQSGFKKRDIIVDDPINRQINYEKLHEQTGLDVATIKDLANKKITYPVMRIKSASGNMENGIRLAATIAYEHCKDDKSVGMLSLAYLDTLGEYDSKLAANQLLDKQVLVISNFNNELIGKISFITSYITTRKDVDKLTILVSSDIGPDTIGVIEDNNRLLVNIK
jgi:hypothetical protein